jgi:hypothetical protein
MERSKSQIRRISVSACHKCLMDKEDIEFWDNHQTMMDGHIWCVHSKTTRVDDLTESILDRYKDK